MEALAAHWLTTKNLVLLAGALHFCQLPAAFVAPNALNWKEELKRLSPLNRRIYIVIALAITFVGLGLGAVRERDATARGRGCARSSGCCISRTFSISSCSSFSFTT